MSHKRLCDQAMIKATREGGRLFRVNAGKFWGGKVLEHSGGILVLKNPTVVLGAPEGVSDLIGWTPVDGRLIFTAVEVKYGRDRLRKSQAAFLDTVRNGGGIAEVIRG